MIAGKLNELMYPLTILSAAALLAEYGFVGFVALDSLFAHAHNFRTLRQSTHE